MRFPCLLRAAVRRRFFSSLLVFPGQGFCLQYAPPLSAEEVVQHYRDHEAGIRGGVALMIFVGFFYHFIPQPSLVKYLAFQEFQKL
jgi:hypothetical protein